MTTPQFIRFTADLVGLLLLFVFMMIWAYFGIIKKFRLRRVWYHKTLMVIALCIAFVNATPRSHYWLLSTAGVLLWMWIAHSEYKALKAIRILRKANKTIDDLFKPEDKSNNLTKT